MIVAVFCVAAAMIAGGVWAVFTGWELIIIERGWTQVLLGGMLLTGGLLLGGIGVLAVHVKRLARSLDQISAKPALAKNGAVANRDAVPSPPPRQELRQEPRMDVAVRPAAVPAEDGPSPAPSAMSAPAAIAVGAAAGAGTAAIASAILSSSPESQPPPVEDEVADPDKNITGAPDEAASSDRLFADFEEPMERGAGDEAIPEPEGEDSTVLAMQDADVAYGSGAEAEPDLQGEDDHVIPPIEEPPQIEQAAEPELEPEELYSAPLEESDGEAGLEEGGPTFQPEVTGDFEEPPLAVEAPAEDTTPNSFSVEPEGFDNVEERLTEETEFPQPEQESVPSDGSGQEAPGEEAGAESEPEQALQEEEGSEPEPLLRSLVGTYESGGNVYTMYSDGSIDAQTPSGNFHVSSLDELKNFIAEGGEDPLA